MGSSPHLCFKKMQNSDFMTRLTSLYRSQTSPVVLCMQNSVTWTRITSLYGFQPTSVVLFIENSDFRTKIEYLNGSRTSLMILCMQNRVPSFRITSPYGTCPHLWFLHAKQRLLDTNNKPLWVPDMTCRFRHAK